jgi:hypothetical protein
MASTCIRDVLSPRLCRAFEGRPVVATIARIKVLIVLGLPDFSIAVTLIDPPSVIWIRGADVVESRTKGVPKEVASGSPVQYVQSLLYPSCEDNHQSPIYVNFSNVLTAGPPMPQSTRLICPFLIFIL